MATTQTDRSNSTPVTNQTDRASGLRSSTAFKGPCIAAASTNTVLTGEQTVNAIACVDGDRVLLTGQTDAKENGIYIVATGAWVRAADFKNSQDVFEGTTVRVTRGTNAGMWVITAPLGDVDIGVDNITLARDSATLTGAALTANNGTDFESRVKTLNNLFGSAATIAAAATTDLSDQSVNTGFWCTISGSTGISAFTMDSQQITMLRFENAPLITVGANLVGNNDGQNIQIEAGDIALVRRSTGGVIYFVHFPIRQRASLAQKGGAIASAGTIAIGDFDYAHVTGTTTITDVDFSKAYDGKKVILEFDSALTITHSANLECPGSTNLSVAAGDVVMFIQDVGDAVKVVHLSPAAAVAVTGVVDEPIPAGAFIPQITNGPSAGVVEIATSLIPLATLDFDATTAERAVCLLRMPKRWNGGTITFEVAWTAASGSGGVAWGLDAQAFSDDDPLSGSYGTQVVVTDTFIAANDVHITSVSAAVTVAGSPANADRVALRISREPSNGSDTLAVDAKLIDVNVQWTAEAGNDA